MQASASAAELKHLLSAKTDHLNSLTRLKWKFRAQESFLGSPLFVFCQALHFLTNTHYNWLWRHTASCCNKWEFEVFEWACASLLLMSAFCGLLKPKFSFDGPGFGSWLCSAAQLMYSSEWKSTLWDSEQMIDVSFDWSLKGNSLGLSQLCQHPVVSLWTRTKTWLLA